MFDFLFNPSGRISRKGYLFGFFLPYMLLLTLPSLLIPGGGKFGIYTTVLGLFFFWPSTIAVPFKRFHDLGRSGWWHIGILAAGTLLGLYASASIVMQAFTDPASVEGALDPAGKPGWQVTRDTFAFIADKPDRLVALVLSMVIQYGEMIFFLAAPGQRAANAYGQDPLASGRGFAD